MPKEYIVYKIEFNNKIIYIGRTNNLKRRTYQHNYNLRKGKGGMLYQFCRDNALEELILTPTHIYKNKVESKRMEMFLILSNYFENNGKLSLYQKVPNISDR